MTDVKLPVIALITALVSIGGNVYTEFNHSDKDLIQRVSRLETARKDDHETLQYLRDKLDSVGHNVDQLVGALLPKHK